MIEKITGVIEKKNKTSLIISVNDISYKIKASLNGIVGLPKIGKKTSLLTYLYVRENLLDLYGFKNEHERKSFFFLTSISGIGPKLAITILSGLLLAWLNGYLHDAMTFSIGSGIPKHTAIGIGMWLGLIMAFNVWFVIWPNQKRALGIVETDPETKAKSAKTAMLFSRTNTLLSLPMLLTMVAAQNIY